MKRSLLQRFSVLVLSTVIFLLFACSSSRQASPSRIGLVPLGAYSFQGDDLVMDTVYRIIQNEDLFNAGFSAANASARRPGFDGQMVVAIIMKTAPATPLRFTGADVSGNVVNVYAQPCTGDDCENSRAVLATIPKVGNARTVQFFVNGERKASLSL